MSKFEELKATLIKNSHRLLSAAYEKCDDDSLVYDAIYNAVKATKLKYKKIINKDIVVELCISLIKKPKKRSKREYTSVDNCIEQAINDFAVRKKPIIATVSVILAIALIIPGLIAGGVIYINAGGFVMDGSVALGNNIRGDETMIKNFGAIGKMGAASFTDLAGTEMRYLSNATEGFRAECDSVTASNGNIYFAQCYYSQDLTKSECIVYKAEKDGWREIGRVDILMVRNKVYSDEKWSENHQITGVELVADNEGDVYVITQYDEGIQIHKCDKRGNLTELQKIFLGKKEFVEEDYSSYHLTDNILSYAIIPVYTKELDKLDLIFERWHSNYKYTVSLNTKTDKISEIQEMDFGEEISIMTNYIPDGEGGMYASIRKYVYDENGIRLPGRYKSYIVHISDGKMTEEIYLGEETRGSVMFVQKLEYENGKLHIIYRKGQIGSSKLRYTVYENGEALFDHRIGAMTLDDYDTQFYFLRDGEMYQAIIAVNEWFVVGKIEGDKKVTKIAEIKLPIKGTAIIYADRHFTPLINNGDTINLVFSEYGASNSTLDIKDTYFGQLILDTEK